MSENMPRYQVRDPQGNVYGPAEAATLRDWVRQGRIIAGMHIADQLTRLVLLPLHFQRHGQVIQQAGIIRPKGQGLLQQFLGMPSILVTDGFPAPLGQYPDALR